MRHITEEYAEPSNVLARSANNLLQPTVARMPLLNFVVVQRVVLSVRLVASVKVGNGD